MRRNGNNILEATIMQKTKLTRMCAFLLTLCLIWGAVGCAGQDAPVTAADYLSLGEKYLLALDYEQAVVQFLQVIEIEPRNPRGYTGAAEAYIALGDVENAIEILRRGLEATDHEAVVSAQLEALLATPRQFSYTNEDGNRVVVYGQTDLEGRLQGVCQLNIFDPATSELIFLEESNFVNDVRQGDSKMIWIDENIKRSFNREKAYGFGVGPYVDGVRYGYTTTECYKDISIREVATGEMIRFEDCAGVDLVYVYRGNRIDGDIKEDMSGNAYRMWIDPETGNKGEYTGQFHNDVYEGYGRLHSSNGWEYEGYFSNGAPVN
jgi:tetratricopeptide (TPR) repeat protein